MTASRRHIGIVGGGVAGLTVAFRCAARGEQVTLLEASERFGGQLWSERSAGYVIEHGAEGFVAGSAAVAELAGALGVPDQIVDQRVSESLYFDGQRLSVLPPGQAGKFLGFQVPSRAFGRGIQSLAQGMDQLSSELVARLPAHARCQLATQVAALARRGQQWELVAQGIPTVRVDEVIVATGANAAARLLAAEFGSRASDLSRSEAVSSVTVSLAYARPQIEHALDATGFVVAEPAQLEGFRACTFVSSKLDGRAPPDRALLRLFFRPTPIELAELADAQWIERARRSAERALVIQGAPVAHWVSRWEQALPVFDAQHRERVAKLEQALQQSGVRLAGAAFHGSGIDGAVRSAEGAAAELAASA